MKDATTDEATIRAWWKQWPDANIGIATGQVSGIGVLDVDNRHNGMDSMRQLESRHGDLPLTLTVRTGNGYHLYYEVAEVRLKNQVNLGGFPGLDFRGDGGYVVAPPSLHASGQMYLWEKGPEEMNPAAMPAWLAETVASSVDGTRRPNPATGNDGIPRGQRNDALFRLASCLRAKGLSLTAISAALQVMNAERCDPPLAAAEVELIARSVTRYPDSANSTNSAKQESTAATWEPPTPFHRFDLPPFPVDALPETLRAYVAALAVATQTPPDVAAMLALSVCAAACAKRVIVQIDDGWIEPVNIFTVSVLKPGNRKSAVFSAVVAPLQEHEAEECQRMAPEVEAARTRYNILKEALKNAERDAARAPTGEEEKRSRDAELLSRELSAMKIPAMPRYIADDSTAERLATLLHEQDGRMALLSPEGGVFDVMAGRYSQDGTANFEVFLKGHAGDDLRVDRVGRPAEHCESPALTLGLAIQPKVLDGLMDRSGFRGRGLLARFLYSLPNSLVGSRKVRPQSVRQDLRNSYHALVRRLLEVPWATDQDGDRTHFPIPLGPVARQRLQHFEEWVEPQLAENGELEGLADWAAKLAGAVGRIAGVLHMVQNAGDREPWNLSIEAMTIDNAVTIGKYLIPHARAAHAVMGADPDVEDAKRILRWIERSGGQAFTKRDAFEGTKGYFRKVAAMEPGLRLLEEHGFVRMREAAPPLGPGRKRSAVYDVNPLWHSQNSHNSQNYVSQHHSANTANCANPPDGRDSANGKSTDEDGEDGTG